MPTSNEEDRKPCGHSDEEHQDQMRYLIQQLSQGDISVLVPRLSNANLELVGQAFASEVMVRSINQEGATRNWREFSDLVESVYLVDSVEDSSSPEHYTDVQTGRERFNEEVEQYNFKAEVEEGLRTLFEQKGVTDESQ